MFNVKQLIEFNFDTRWYYYVIINTDEFIDMSIFTKEEWVKLQKFNEKFRGEQLILESLYDEYYKLMFSKNNHDYEKNCNYRKVIYYLDKELKNKFGTNFNKLIPIEENEEKLKSIYKELYWKTFENNNNNRECKKDKLRLWFIENYEILKKYYDSILDVN